MRKVSPRNALLKLIDRAGLSLDKSWALANSVRSEAMLSLAKNSDWAWLNARAYERNSGYDDPDYNTSLFDWEEKAFDAFFPKAPARILVGGCGGGREMHGLAMRGFQVAGFDPAEKFISMCRSRVPKEQLLDAAVGCFEQFVKGIESIDTLGPFDAGIVGFGSFAHLASEHDRITLLQSFLKHCPTGPLLLSWVSAPKGNGRGRVRKTFQRLGLPVRAQSDVYTPSEGFMHFFEHDELQRIFEQGGYRCVRYDELRKYPFAVLLPKA